MRKLVSKLCKYLMVSTFWFLPHYCRAWWPRHGTREFVCGSACFSRLKFAYVIIPLLSAKLDLVTLLTSYLGPLDFQFLDQNGNQHVLKDIAPLETKMYLLRPEILSGFFLTSF
jgi:hypothetical protein